jgi:hypothetical protein
MHRVGFQRREVSRGGRVVGGGTGDQLRTAHDDHPWRAGAGEQWRILLKGNPSDWRRPLLVTISRPGPDLNPHGPDLRKPVQLGPCWTLSHGISAGQALLAMCPRTDCTKKPMPSELRVFSGRPRWCAMTTTQHVIKWSTACAVVGVAAIAAVASRDAGSRAGALAPRPGHRSDARSQRCPWPGTWAYRRGGGRVAGDHARRLLRTPDDGHPKFSGRIR